MDKLKKKSFREGHRSIILVGAMIFIGLFLMNFASAELFQFDNVKNYDALTQKVEIRNSVLGIPFLQLGKIADVKWNTPINVQTGYGDVFKVAEFENIPYEDYVNAFDMEKMEFYDLNNNMKKITREVEFKVKSYEIIIVDDYKEVCGEVLSKNGTKSCENIISGSHEEQKEVWLPLEKYDFIKGENQTVGIFTYVYKGDYVEMIPNFYGLRLTEFSSWSASLDNGIIAYYSADEGSGTITQDNVTLTHNGTDVNSNVVGGTGIIGKGLNFNGINGYETTQGFIDLNSTDSFSISFWTNVSTIGDGFLFHKRIGTNQFSLDYYSNELDFYLWTSTGQIKCASPVGYFTGNASSWVFTTITYNQTHMAIWKNGVISTTKAETGTINHNAGTFQIGYLGGSAYLFGHMDEIGIWNRSLTQTEITELYNGGVGLAYGDYLPTPQVTLNSPINYFNTTNPAITFNITATDEQQIINVTLYIDGILNETDTSQTNGTYLFNKTLNEGSHNWSILAYNNNSKSTQSSTRYLTINTTPFIEFLTPPTLVNYANITQEYIPMKVNISTNYFKNISFYLENENGTSYTQYFTNQTLDINFTDIPDAHYHYNVTICTTTNKCNITETRHINHDTSPPTLSVTGLSSAYNSTSPIKITWSLFSADDHVGSCWYYTSDNATNISVTCNTSTITNFTTIGSKTIYYFGNDTLGNLATGSSTLFIGYYPYNHNSNPTSIGEGNSVVFTLYVNGTSINTQFGDTNATINFNGTTYTPDATDKTNADYIKFTKTIIVTGGNSTGMNYPFNWTYNVKNSTTTVLTQLTDTKNVAVYSMTITDASVTCGRNILNMTIKNEETNVAIVPASNSTNIQLDLTITSRSNISLTWNFSKTWINNYTVGVCVPSALLTSSTYKIDFTVGYKATGFVQEFYYMDNGTLENTGTFNSYTNSNISLMDLANGDSTTFLFKFKDENNLQVDDAIIHVYRKYIGEGLFREVERASEDNNGETHVHLVEEDVIYYFMVTQYGNIIHTSSQYNAKCLSTPCQIELTASASFIEFPTDYDQINGTSYLITRDLTARTVTLTFLSDVSKTINLSLFKYNNGTVSYINTSSLTGTSGVITLNVPSSFGNQTFFASIFDNGLFIRSEWVDFKEKAQDYFGTTGAILGGLIVLALIFMAISEGVILIVIGVLAILIIGAMQLVDLSWLALISIICAGALIIWKLTSGGKR